MVLKAWHMIPETDVVSQFDRNYAGRDMTPSEIEARIGVTYYQVNNLTIFYKLE